MDDALRFFMDGASAHPAWPGARLPVIDPSTEAPSAEIEDVVGYEAA